MTQRERPGPNSQGVLLEAGDGRTGHGKAAHDIGQGLDPGVGCGFQHSGVQVAVEEHVEVLVGCDAAHQLFGQGVCAGFSGVAVGFSGGQFPHGDVGQAVQERGVVADAAGAAKSSAARD